MVKRFALVLLASLLAALALVGWSPAYAGGAVQPVPNATAYMCYYGPDTYGAPFKTSQTAACNAFFGLASRQGNYMATRVVQDSDCQYTTQWAVNGTSFTKYYTVTTRKAGLPPGWCGKDTTSSYQAQFQQKAVKTCPDNATPDDADNVNACTCNAGYKPDAQSQQCIADCTPNETASSGYYDIGPNQGASPQLSGCAGTCRVYFDGTSPVGSAMVDGVKHWFAKGSYHYSGDACSSADQTTKQVGNGTGTKPPDTCRADEDKGTINGKAVCVKRQDGAVTDDSKKTATTSTEKTSTTNPDGSTTTTERTTTTDGNGNKTVTERRTTTRPDGSVSVEETTSGMPGSSSGSGTGADTGTDDGSDDDSPCKRNPSSTGCGGEPASVGSLYTAKDKTMAGVLSAHRDTFMASPIGAAAGGFFLVSGGGACPTFSKHIPLLEVDLTLDQFCSDFATDALTLFRSALLLCCSFFAFRIAVE